MHTDRISGTSYPGIETLTRECGGSRSSIIWALKNLVSGGFIRKRLCGRHNKYQLALYYQNKDSESDTAPSNVVPIKIKNYEVASKGCQSDTQTGVSLTSNRCQADTLTDHKQIIKRRQEAKPALSVTDAVKSYNTMATKNRLPSCMGLNNKRKTAIHKLLVNHGSEAWNTLLNKIANTDFLKGKSSRGWQVTFDYAIREDKFLKIIEGDYDSWRKQSAQAHSPGPRRYSDDRPAPKPPKDDWREILVQAGMKQAY